MTIEEAIIHGREQLKNFDGEHAEFIWLSIEALEKQKPKKPNGTNSEYVMRCPICNAVVIQNILTEQTDYCIRCGQKLDWEVSKNDD